MFRFVKILGCVAAVILFGVADSKAANLPRVMILCDETYAPAAAEVTKSLKGKAIVVVTKMPDNLPPNTASAVEAFDRIIGKDKWDIIIFNLGIGDLTHRAPKMKSFRLMASEAGGVRTTSAADYGRNLDVLVQKLSQTRARLMWMSTLPINNGSNGVLISGSEEEYNRISETVMNKYRVTILDMHAYAKKLIETQGKRAPDVYSISKTIPLNTPILEATNHALNGAPTQPKNNPKNLPSKP